MNPFDALLEATRNDPLRIQAAYEHHRTERNADQAALMRAPSFPGPTPDPILRALLRLDPPSPDTAAPFVDPRNALSLWARPPPPVRALVTALQRRLAALARLGPHTLWLAPEGALHLSVLEVAHHETPGAVAALLARLAPELPGLLALPRERGARLFRPQLACDPGSLVLKFLPVVDEGRSVVEGGTVTGCEKGGGYTYHHLRRELFERVAALGVHMAPRYVVPSAHLTVARFVGTADFERPAAVDSGDGNRETDPARISALWDAVDAINVELAGQYDARSGGDDGAGMWTVEDVEWRYGAQWYGGGQSWRAESAL